MPVRPTTVATVVLLLGLTGSLQAGTLEEVQARGVLNCVVSTGIAGADDAGKWQGFNIDFCRTTAATVFGVPNAVEAVPATGKTAFRQDQGGASTCTDGAPTEMERLADVFKGTNFEVVIIELDDPAGRCDPTFTHSVAELIEQRAPVSGDGDGEDRDKVFGTFDAFIAGAEVDDDAADECDLWLTMQEYYDCLRARRISDALLYLLLSEYLEQSRNRQKQTATLLGLGQEKVIGEDDGLTTYRELHDRQRWTQTVPRSHFGLDRNDPLQPFSGIGNSFVIK